MVTIEIRGKQATVENLSWMSDDEQVKTVLNNLFAEVMGVDPFPDLTVANLALERLKGGKILSVTDIPTFIEGRIY